MQLSPPPDATGPDGLYKIWVAKSFYYSDFPRLMRDMVSRAPGSVIRSNFDLAEPWDVAQIIEDSREWRNLTVWDRYSGRMRGEYVIGPAPPLPGWRSILGENVLSYQNLPNDAWKDFDESF